jgi:hypothetical protein
MIIRREDDALLCITQPDHARLAADILAGWTLDGFAAHPRRTAILTAAREHDNGWIEEDAATHVDAWGEPQDFISVPAAVKHRIWPRATTRLAAADPYVAALVAEHALTLHGQQRADPAWQGFFARMDAIRADLLGRCGGDAAATIAADYPFVRAADQLSLIFCNGWRTPFTLPGARALLREALEVRPDPFAGAHVPLRVEGRRLPARTYASPADLRAAFAAAPVVELCGTATGQRAGEWQIR